VAIAASALALYVASRPALPLMVLTVSSLLMGGAINGMHYIGMAAMIVPVLIIWRISLIVLSIVIAVTASFGALVLAFRLRRSTGGIFRWSRAGAAAVMGIAIVGMHYTGMAAARFGPATVVVEREGTTLHLQGLSLAVIASTGLILGVALASAMIDDRARLLAREQQARYDAEAANRLKDEFLATLSHELRTPLNVILGRTQMLRSLGDHSDAANRTINAIDKNAQALARLVDDLLDVSRITLGQIQMDLQRVQLGDVLEAAAFGIQTAANAKGIRVIIDAPARLPDVIGDPIRLQQVVWNLLTNAVKFTPRGGQITAAVRRDDSALVLTVSDSGEGIDPTFLPHLFDMFRQGDSAITRAHGGLGLGLSIVRRLVELHGGTVAAASAGRGHGATFTVSLPYPGNWIATTSEPIPYQHQESHVRG
jgi:diguanylate cyclase